MHFRAKKNLDENKLKKYHSKLVYYIRNKERLTRDNLISFEKRGSNIGFFTSFSPPISIRKLMQNYAEKKGVLYKIFHFGGKYESGENILLPNLRAYIGAKFKDFFTNRSNIKSLEIRRNNIGYAQELLCQIDVILYGTALTNIDFPQEIYDQLMIKEQRNELDSYYYLLKKIYKNLNQIGVNISKDDLKKKSDYLDSISVTPAVINAKRGEYINSQDSPTIMQNYLCSSQQYDFVVIEPNEPFSHPHIDETLSISRIIRWGDKCMHMVMDENKYHDYYIRGVESISGRLVGKNNELLSDGWYQFVIIKDPRIGGPVIRYYPCAEKKEGVPFIKQNPSISTEAVDDEGYLIQKPENFSLKYEKYIAHSELAGELPVNAAGAFMIKEGKLRVIEDSSGHYARKKTADDPHRSLKICWDLFRHYGVDTKETVLERWEPYHGLDKLLKKGAAAITQFFESSSLKKHGISPQLAELRPTQPQNGNKSPIQLLIELS